MQLVKFRTQRITQRRDLVEQFGIRHRSLEALVVVRIFLPARAAAEQLATYFSAIVGMNSVEADFVSLAIRPLRGVVAMQDDDRT